MCSTALWILDTVFNGSVSSSGLLYPYGEGAGDTWLQNGCTTGSGNTLSLQPGFPFFGSTMNGLRVRGSFLFCLLANDADLSYLPIRKKIFSTCCTHHDYHVNVFHCVYCELSDDMISFTICTSACSEKPVNRCAFHAA